MRTTKSSFTLVIYTPTYLLIKDNANEMQTMSITNDAENVIQYLFERRELKPEMTVFYIDTDNRVDILEHDGHGNFTGFKPGYSCEDDFYNEFLTITK